MTDEQHTALYRHLNNAYDGWWGGRLVVGVRVRVRASVRVRVRVRARVRGGRRARARARWWV